MSNIFMIAEGLLSRIYLACLRYPRKGSFLCSGSVAQAVVVAGILSHRCSLFLIRYLDIPTYPTSSILYCLAHFVVMADSRHRPDVKEIKSVL